jgi:ElaB/YqjD/DUF883 family membrane-anchored ribosome-binding protein
VQDSLCLEPLVVDLLVKSCQGIVSSHLQFAIDSNKEAAMSREANNPFDEGMGSSERIDEKIDDIRDRAASIGAKIKDKASQFGSTVSSGVDRQRETAARGLDRAASSLHDGVGSAAKVGHGLADGMESTASYLRSHNFGEMGNDVMTLCRKHPVQALVSAAVLGFVMGRLIRR